MPRLREYDPDSVLTAAMRTFWKRGYDGTSIRDLVEASGLTTRSMYDAYRNKDRLFEAALDRYSEVVLEPAIVLLDAARGRAAIERFVQLVASGATVDGCLFVNTAAERSRVKRPALRRVERYFGRLREAFRRKLEEARLDGTFNGDSDVRSVQFVVTVAGFMMALKLGLARDDAGAALRQLLEDLTPC